MYGRTEAHPLRDVVIVDTTQILSGPFGTMLLGDLGAEIIKVERIGVGERSRNTEHGDYYYDAVNRNKRSLSIDLKSDDGQRILDELLAEADVFVENMTKEGADKFDLTYERTSGVNESIVHCSVKGFRTGSAYESFPSLDIVPQAMAGVMSMTGEADGPPMWPKLQIGDLSASLFAVQAILAALYGRELGIIEGEFVEVPMLDATVSLMAARASHTFATGEPFPRGKYPPGAPSGVFECADGYVAILVVWPDVWEQFQAALGAPDALEDEQFDSPKKRAENEDALNDVLNDVLAPKSVEHWVEKLREYSIPVAPVYDTKNMWEDEYIASLRDSMEREDQRDAEVVDNPFYFENLSADFVSPPESLGSSTESVLQNHGFSTEEIEEFRDDGVVD